MNQVRMKLIVSFLIFTFISSAFLSQNLANNNKNDLKETFYFYWGWNRGWYSNSDISFKGTDYDFKLSDVKAYDRQSEFELNTYLNPLNATIPQYNFRFGYYINNKYNVSFGIDHMKYVVASNQSVKISGNINNTGTVYDRNYDNDDIIIKHDFLKLEHTDGLNYINIECRRLDEILSEKKIKINITEGVGIGILLPKTNVTLFNNERYDEFHLSGYGISSVLGIEIIPYKTIFIQSELKGGFIHLPSIRTTMSDSDMASQSFFFTQLNIVFGARFKINNTHQTKNVIDHE